MKENTEPKKKQFEFESNHPGFAANLTKERIKEIAGDLVEGRANASIEELRAVAIYWGGRWADARDDMMAMKQATGMLMAGAKVSETAIAQLTKILGMKGTVVLQTGDEAGEFFKESRDN